MTTDSSSRTTLSAKRLRHAQILLCEGGACGNCSNGGTIKVPLAHLRALWKERNLTPQVSLAVTSCLGPCEIANVCVIVTQAGSTWLGRLESADYDRLADWAQACADGPTPLPRALQAKEFSRWQAQG